MIAFVWTNLADCIAEHVLHYPTIAIKIQLTNKLCFPDWGRIARIVNQVQPELQQ